VGVAVPVWDRNQGRIKQAGAELASAGEEAQRARLDLRNRAAAAFERYRTGQQIVELYRGQVLPDLVRVYRGVYDRYQKEPDKVNFNDVSTAQQNLANAVNNYLSGLSTLWGGVVDIAGLLQTDDLFGTTKTDCLEPLPDLDALLKAPCPHP
jgi:cobalt-zinc-cadmium efflux system outer membrane protein